MPSSSSTTRTRRGSPAIPGLYQEALCLSHRRAHLAGPTRDGDGCLLEDDAELLGLVAQEAAALLEAALGAGSRLAADTFESVEVTEIALPRPRTTRRTALPYHHSSVITGSRKPDVTLHYIALRQGSRVNFFAARWA